jgi:hypothetical protein
MLHNVTSCRSPPPPRPILSPVLESRESQDPILCTHTPASPDTDPYKNSYQGWFVRYPRRNFQEMVQDGNFKHNWISSGNNKLTPIHRSSTVPSQCEQTVPCHILTLHGTVFPAPLTLTLLKILHCSQRSYLCGLPLFHMHTGF